jgi:hypothetical protein
MLQNGGMDYLPNFKGQVPGKEWCDGYMRIEIKQETPTSARK